MKKLVCLYFVRLVLRSIAEQQTEQWTIHCTIHTPVSMSILVADAILEIKTNTYMRGKVRSIWKWRIVD